MGLCQRGQAQACPHHLVLVASGGGLLLICHVSLPSYWCHFVLESEAPASNTFISVLTQVESLLMQTPMLSTLSHALVLAADFGIRDTLCLPPVHESCASTKGKKLSTSGFECLLQQ